MIDHSTIPLPPGAYVDYHALYQQRLVQLRSLTELQQLMAFWLPLVADAAEVVAKMTTAEWEDFHHGVQAVLTNYDVPDVRWKARYDTILEPQILWLVDHVAAQHHIPWGAAYNRMAYADLLAVGLDGLVHAKEGEA